MLANDSVLYLILCVSQNSFHRSLSSGLDDLLDVIIFGLKGRSKKMVSNGSGLMNLAQLNIYQSSKDLKTIK